MVVLALFLWFSLCMIEKFIAYQRVSTKSQGDSGNGLNAQVQLNEEYANSVSGEIVASFTDDKSKLDSLFDKNLEETKVALKKINS